MAVKKFDGVIEAVRYADGEHAEFVRAYERRGAVFSDVILLSRQELIARLKRGRRYVAGRRVPYLGATFETGPQVRLARTDQREVLTTGSQAGEGDRLEGVPLV
jgi:hypothetical protein